MYLILQCIASYLGCAILTTISTTTLSYLSIEDKLETLISIGIDIFVPLLISFFISADSFWKIIFQSMALAPIVLAGYASMLFYYYEFDFDKKLVQVLSISILLGIITNYAIFTL